MRMTGAFKRPRGLLTVALFFTSLFLLKDGKELALARTSGFTFTPIEGPLGMNDSASIGPNF